MSQNKTKNEFFTLATAQGQPKETLGGKGWGLAEMTRLGLRVPSAVILPTSLMGVKDRGEIVEAAIKELKKEVDQDEEFLLSIRSGAPISMPGMMDTILNVPSEDFHSIMTAVERVFLSWDTPRAKVFRAINKIPEALGTACVIQRMVNGKKGGTGVVFSRDPNTGEKVLYGEWLKGAIGEDLVGGKKTPKDILAMEKDGFKTRLGELAAILKRLEEEFKDVQEVEFTIEDQVLWLLQTRRAARSDEAAWVILEDLRKEGMIDSFEYGFRKQALPPRTGKEGIVIEEEPKVIGIGASSGIVSGRICLSAEKVEVMGKKLHDPVILVAKETTPLDMVGFVGAVGVLTQIGGVTSHAAVNGRAMGLAVVVGLGGLLGIGATYISLGGKAIPEGEWITIDGATGKVWLGDLLAKEAKVA